MRWYVLRTMVGYEKRLSEDAERLDLDLYQPEEVRVYRHHRTKRLLEKTRPLFPGYAFLRTREEDLVRHARSLRPVVGILQTASDNPVPVPLADGTVDEIRRAQDAGAYDLRRSRDHDFSYGDAVRVMVADVVFRAVVVELRGCSSVLVEGETPLGVLRAECIGRDLLPA